MCPIYNILSEQKARAEEAKLLYDRVVIQIPGPIPGTIQLPNIGQYKYTVYRFNDLTGNQRQELKILVEVPGLANSDFGVTRHDNTFDLQFSKALFFTEQNKNVIPLQANKNIFQGIIEQQIEIEDLVQLWGDHTREYFPPN